MKKLFIYILPIFLLFVPLVNSAQNNELIIGAETDSVYIIDFEDFLLSTDNPNWHYYLDLNDNGIWDLHFSVYEDGGYYGGEGGTKLTSGDSTYFVRDTLATQWIGPWEDLYLDTTNQVKKHTLNDTLTIYDHFVSGTTNIAYKEQGMGYVSQWLVDWLNGTNYIGIKKVLENKTILGWVKVEFYLSALEITIKEFALNSYLDTWPQIKINEFIASNNETFADEYGQYEDWIELYNTGDDSVYLGDLYLTDSFSIPNKWNLPDVYLQPGELVVFWADDQQWQGEYHTNFELDEQGGEIGLFEGATTLKIDACTFVEQSSNVSFGRTHDGWSTWILFENPTPGASNQTTGTNEQIEYTNILIFPNPTTGITVNLSRIINYKVYNIYGQIVGEGNNSDQINISGYKMGIYIVVSDEGVKQKLIVN